MGTKSEIDDLCNQPLEVVSGPGAVVLVGPDGVALAMTVAAAKRSVELLEEAIKAAEAEA